MSNKISLKDLKREGRKKKIVKENVFLIEDFYEQCSSTKLSKKLKTGLVYDDQFILHRCTWDEQYPENPKRYTSIIKRLEDYSLIERCERIPTRTATREEILTKHDPELINLLSTTKENSNENDLELLATKYDAVYFNQSTFDAACLAAGSAIDLTRAVVNNEVQNGMAVVRPPGHHAMRDQYCGYCFFNNVALAAQYALDNLGVKKILIVDWDVHHGQATQRMFYDDPRVLYFSIHRYEQGDFWPNLRESNFDFVGANNGYGYNINIPLNEIKCDDADYLTIFHSILLPVAYEFAPDLILVSAGFDAAIGCTEGQMSVSPGCYHHLTTSLMALAKGKVVVLLEGGYFIPSLAEGAAQTLRALLGDPAPVLETLNPVKKSVLTTIYNVISILRLKWNCFQHFNNNKELKLDSDEKNKIPEHKVEIIYIGEEKLQPYPTRNCYPVHSTAEAKMFSDEVDRLRNNYYIKHPLSKVGYVYDNQMELHDSPSVNKFERPERLSRTIEIFSELDILNRMELQQSREATVDEISTIHKDAYVTKILNLTPHTEAELNAEEGWMTVFTNANTEKSSRIAVGSLLELVKSVLDGRVSNGIGLIRPPGHHAEIDAASGFCFFNNVAIATKYALNRGLERILILDWDVHHGNGIQRIFYNDSRVLYVSLHRYDDGSFFPYSKEANYTEVGANAGQGFNVNIAWNQATMGDSEYIHAFTRLILPVAYQFNPELVIVAAGFDACKGDPLGGYSVSPEAYGHFTQLLKPLAAGRIIIALEGGYNVSSVGYSIAMCSKALLNDPLPMLKSCDRICDSAVLSVNNTIGLHNQKWFLLLKNVRFIIETEKLSNENQG